MSNSGAVVEDRLVLVGFGPSGLGDLQLKHP